MKIRSAQVAPLAAVVLFTVICARPSVAQKSRSCGGATLPAPAQELLNKQFSQWRPKAVSDLEPGDQQLWLKTHEKGCPGIAVGHFERPDQLAYAVLLVPKSEPTGGYKIVVSSKGPTGDAYAWKLLDHAEGRTYSELVISKAAPGKYSDFENTQSVQLKLNSIFVEWIEKGAQLYY